MAEPPHTSEYSRSSVHPALMTVAFLEGFIVLAVELISAKMIAPFYGVSLIVWATVIGITLASLTTGYFIGGFLSKLDGSKAILFRILLFSALMMALMPLIAQSILYYFDRFGLSNGILLSAFILISPSLILLGATSPILIQLVTKNVDRSGKAAGNIYAISTAGGILSTFLFGFFIIPEWGLRIPVLVLAFLLFAASQLLLYQKKQILFSGIILSLTILISFMIIRPNDPVLKYGLKLFGKDFSDRNNFHLLLNSEGLLGQLKVLDHFEEDDSVTIHRQLLINGIPQTYVLIDSGMTSYWQYVHTIATLSTLIIDKSEALLFGFGGGSLALELIEQGFKVDAVEIDNRMWEITEQYFELDKENTTMIIDDARHYLKTTNKKYDIIIFDLASAEVQPSYVFTLESFLEMSDLLDENGMIIINYQGYATGKYNKAFKSIYKTLLVAGYTTYYWNNYPGSFSDILFIASKSTIDFTALSVSKLNYCCASLDYIHNYIESPLTQTEIDTTNAYVFVDDKPLLESLTAEVIFEWRNYAVKMIAKEGMREGIRIFE